MEKARAVTGTLDEMGLKEAAKCVRDGILKKWENPQPGTGATYRFG